MSFINATEYRSYFEPAASRPLHLRIKCDFSLPWVRMAWNLTLRQKRSNFRLVEDIANIDATTEPCPSNEPSTQWWYTVYDPDTNRRLSEFDVCQYCVKCLETLSPTLKGVFQRSNDGPQFRACDLRFSSHRFLGYIQQLEAAASEAEKSKKPIDLHSFTDYTRKRTSMRECAGAHLLHEQPWHIRPDVPDFTVCEECYHDVVWESITGGSEVADKFSRRMQPVGKRDEAKMCMLGTEEMREVWRLAVGREEVEVLKDGAWEMMNRLQAQQQAQQQQQAPYTYGVGW